MMWNLIHRKDQGGCGGVAFESRTDPQDWKPPGNAKCWACGGRLEKWHWRLRNFETKEGTNHD